MRKLLSIFLIVSFLGVVVWGWWNNQLSAPSFRKETKKIVIPKGTGLSTVSSQLKKENLIKSELAFKLFARQKGLADKLQTGTFELSSSMSAEEVLKTLTSNPKEVWVTFLEGWRVEEMAQKLGEQLGIKKEDFLEYAKEGYMFPDTYLFPDEVTAARVADIMKDNFKNKYSAELRSKIKSQGLTEQEGVVLASIVEREARSDIARTEVAGILLKRLKINMGLNADATIQYALGYQPKERSWWKRNLTYDDLKIDSVYNTYIHAGLPPTPICNPSLSSLKAVANANSSTPYLYYLHDSKGNSYYAKTLEGHNQNIANHP
ncbi:endolytic transglycosylase MltG [Candidatus Daviesbacteria bacterium]|nr:endolytic transglycosylase MltG [Candidatus Daviesbacteria bacterium]